MATAIVPAPAGMDGKEQVPKEHHEYAESYAASIADFVGNSAANDGQEINKHEECCIHGSGNSFAPSEVCLQEEYEDSQHRVVAKALASVGKCKCIKTFWLVFKHSF